MWHLDEQNFQKSDKFIGYIILYLFILFLSSDELYLSHTQLYRV